METESDTWEQMCTGCLSKGRHITHLTGAAADFFNDIVTAAGGLLGGAVCWECKAQVHRGLKFRAIVTRAVHSFTSNQLNRVSFFTSLSRLSCQSANNVIYTTHDADLASPDPEQSPLFVKIEDDSFVDNDLEYHEDNNKDSKATLKSHSNHKKKRHKKKTKSSDKNKKEEFDDSDEEPLASKKSTTEGDGKEKKRGRGRREGASGVVLNARVRGKLARLGLQPGDVDMVVLSWEEVEEERQRALLSDSYLRHDHRCESCATGFNHRLKLERHMEKHSVEAGEFECSVCGVRCRAAHALAAHRRRHRVRWRCGECGALWSRLAVAADHRQRAHGAPAPAHACPAPACSHVAVSLSQLRAHMRTHAAARAAAGAQLTCAECGKPCRDRSALRTHLFSHRADRSHRCELCPARFLYPRALRLHTLTHRPPAPRYCPQCDVTFKNPMSYYQHMKYSLKHVHPDKLKHACSVCGARFVRAARLADHVAARHERRAPHRCDVTGCNYRSASRAVLRAHMRSVHAPAPRPPRRLVCHACGHIYASKKSLERHLKLHSNNESASRTDKKVTHAPITDASVTDIHQHYVPHTETFKVVQKEV